VARDCRYRPFQLTDYNLALSVEIRCSAENKRRMNSNQKTITDLSQSRVDLNFAPLASQLNRIDDVTTFRSIRKEF